VVPVFRSIEPGGKSQVTVARRPAVVKEDFVEVVVAPVRRKKF
jgi:hypothetical protein